MALVGDVIQGVRELIPDPAPTLAAPVIGSVTPVTSTGTLVFGAATYTIAVTIVTPWGETLPATQTGVILTGVTNTFSIVLGLPLVSATPMQINVYVTPTGGITSLFSYPNNPPNPLVMNTGTPVNQYPPTRNTAYLPDMDGQFASASMVFRWLNRGLFELSRTCGGIRDYAGVRAMYGQSLYVLPSNWIAITDIWYAGYWMQGGQRGNFFRANSIIAQILTSATISVQDNRTILEVYPQPANSGGTSSLTAAMGLTDTTVSIANSDFVSLPFGFVQVDKEIMAYAATATGYLTGLIRGLGGNIPATHAIGAAITELNLVVNGRRVFEGAYQPGSSGVHMPIPPGWADILIDYVMGQARAAEQDNQTAQTYMKSFSQKTAEWARSNLNAVKRRQIGPASVPEAYYGGVPGGGGWIIP